MSANAKPPTSTGKPPSRSPAKSEAKSPAKSPTRSPHQSASPAIPSVQNLTQMFEFYARIVKLIILRKDDTDG